MWAGELVAPVFVTGGNVSGVGTNNAAEVDDSFVEGVVEGVVVVSVLVLVAGDGIADVIIFCFSCCAPAWAMLPNICTKIKCFASNFQFFLTLDLNILHLLMKFLVKYKLELLDICVLFIFLISYSFLLILTFFY